jgi:tRNA threonylcarbamoyladenosine biosynthesis protein TsaB
MSERSDVHADRRILILETSGRHGSAALADARGMLETRRLAGRMRHAGELLPAIREMLARQGWQSTRLTDVFVSVGPGSFTGLRVGVTVARTLAWSVKLRVVAVPTLDVVARNALAADPVPSRAAVLFDAKRGQVYAATFECDAGSGQCRTIRDAHLADPWSLLAACPRPLAVLGEGVAYHREAIADSGARVLDEALWWPTPEGVYRVGLELAGANRYTPGADLLPFYIRRPEAEEKWEARYGPGGRRPR